MGKSAECNQEGGRRTFVHHIAGRTFVHQRLEIRNKSIENRGCDNAHAYGRYKNVFLCDGELTELQAELPDSWQDYIDRLSEYMASTGKQYQNHAARDRKKDEPQGRNRDYSVQEGETV